MVKLHVCSTIHLYSAWPNVHFLFVLQSFDLNQDVLLPHLVIKSPMITEVVYLISHLQIR